MHNKWKIFILLVVLSLFVTACSPQDPLGTDDQQPELIREEQFVLGGTFGKIHGYSDVSQQGRDTISRAFQRIHSIENTMSVAIEGSDVYHLNANAGHEAVEVTDETLKMIKDGIHFYELTDGAFNIALGAISDLWGINRVDGNTPDRLPSTEEIETAQQHIDLGNLEINGNKVFIRDANMSIDLGGIAKGYAVDEAARVLEEEGIKSGFVDLGGDIYVLDSKPDGSKWNMGITNPMKDLEPSSNPILASLPLANKAIVTSGDYERTLIINDEQYHHIIDPATGYPTDNELTSTTIIADTAMEADVFSTAVFIMGFHKGVAFIEDLPGVEGIFVTKDKEVYITSGIREEVNILDNSFTVLE